MQNFFDCDYGRRPAHRRRPDAARDRASSSAPRDHELPALCEDFGFDAAAGAGGSTAYVRELQDWIAGILNWHQKTVRYGESELVRSRGGHGFALPTGFGTSAVRMFAP